MAEQIPASTTIRVPLQAFLSSDHVTPATGVTIACTISKNGAAYGNPSGGATNAVEIGAGSYYVDLSTTDTGTNGPLFVKGTSATIDNVIAIYNVVNQHNGAFDALPNIASGSVGAVLVDGVGTAAIANSAGKVLLQATQTGVTIPTVTTVGSVSGAVGSVTGAVGSVTGAFGSVTGNVGGNVTGSVGSVAGAVGSVTGNVGGNVVGTVASVVGAVGSVTGNVGGNVTGSVGSLATQAKTDVAAAWAAATLAACTGLPTTNGQALTFVVQQRNNREHADKDTGIVQLFESDGVTVKSSQTYASTAATADRSAMS